MADDLLIVDDRGTGDNRSALGTSWPLVTDGVEITLIQLVRAGFGLTPERTRAPQC